MRTNFRQLFSIFVIVLAFSACSNKQSKTLSRNDITAFLVELHELDGALIVRGMGGADDRRNLYYYNALLKKHNITQAQFDSTMAYYARNPKKLERVYTDVLEELTKMDEKVKSGYFHPVDSAALRNSHEEIWPLTKTLYQFSKDSTPVRINFVVKNRQLAWNDSYKLSFLHRVGKSDKAPNKNAVIRIHYKNKITDSIVCKTISDSLLRRYSITIKARRQATIDSVSGAIVNYKPTKGSFNALIDSIKLTRKYDAVAQDSVRTVVMTIENPQPQLVSQKELLRLRSKILLQRKYEKPK